jgi:hypothetical protein
MREQGSYHQPDHWTDRQFTRGMGEKPVAGIRPSDAQAFCDWLSERNPGPWRFRLPTAEEKSRPPLNQPALEEEANPVGYWYLDKGQPGLEPSPDLTHDVALVQTLQRQLEQKFLNDLIIFQGWAEDDPLINSLRASILARSKARAHSLLDLERRLPLTENGGEEIGRYFSLIQDRNAEGVATDMEEALIHAKAYVDNPNFTAIRGPILQEIIVMGNRLLASLEDLPFPPEITRLMHQLMQDLDRAHNQLTTTRQNLQAEFLSYRELVRHINRALFNAQKLLDELSYSRADARIRLRINVLQRSLQMLQHHSTTTTEETSQSRRKRLQHFQMLIDLYVDIAILESRKNYNSTALEGIRVIREATPW